MRLLTISLKPKSTIKSTPKTSVEAPEFKDSTTLEDGLEVLRAFESDAIEAKRIAALNKLGSNWVGHPDRHVKKKFS